MSKLQLMIIGILLIGWGILMLYIHYRDKKRMKEIDKEWEERRRRWQQDRIDWQWNEVNQYWQRGRRSAWVPYDEVRPKTDKLSPPKKMGKHTMR